MQGKENEKAEIRYWLTTVGAYKYRIITIITIINSGYQYLTLNNNNNNNNNILFRERKSEKGHITDDNHK